MSHVRQRDAASAAAPLDSMSAVHLTTGPSVRKASAEQTRILHTVLRASLDEARKHGDASASARAIAHRLGISHNTVAESLSGRRVLSAERALLDTPLTVAEDFVERVLAPRRAQLGDRAVVHALRLAVERIERRVMSVGGDELVDADAAITDAIETLQRIKRERRSA